MSKKKWIVWEEPVPGLNAEGVEVTCTQQVRMTKEDVICVMRHIFAKRKIVNMNEELMVLEFMVVHYACRLEEE